MSVLKVGTTHSYDSKPNNNTYQARIMEQLLMVSEPGYVADIPVPLCKLQ